MLLLFDAPRLGHLQAAFNLFGYLHHTTNDSPLLIRTLLIRLSLLHDRVYDTWKEVLPRLVLKNPKPPNPLQVGGHSKRSKR